tara:strand:+ start:351 stop:488 length:138 start_codon:yes stop_codon:yes gene_type:complete
VASLFDLSEAIKALEQELGGVSPAAQNGLTRLNMVHNNLLRQWTV